MHYSIRLRVEMMWVRHNPGAEELMLIMPARPNILTGSTRIREVVFPAYRIAWVNRMSLNPLTDYRAGMGYEATRGTVAGRAMRQSAEWSFDKASLGGAIAIPALGGARLCSEEERALPQQATVSRWLISSVKADSAAMNGMSALSVSQKAAICVLWLNLSRGGWLTRMSGWYFIQLGR
jgi:hypothetical protein